MYSFFSLMEKRINCMSLRIFIDDYGIMPKRRQKAMHIKGYPHLGQDGYGMERWYYEKEKHQGNK